MENLIPIIGSEYCVPKAIKLVIDTDKGVTHINNEWIFQVDKPSFPHHRRRVLCDVSGKPVLTLYKKHATLHDRWQVFKCDSDDLIFSVKRTSSKTPNKNNIALEVFLANNTEERVFDYKVNAGSGKTSCDIYAHGSSTIFANMMINENTFEGEVQPNVDYAFIVALITIVDEINNNSGGNVMMGEVMENAQNALEAGVLRVASMGEALSKIVDMYNDW